MRDSHLPVFEHFETNSKVCLHRPERGRLALAEPPPAARHGCEN